MFASFFRRNCGASTWSRSTTYIIRSPASFQRMMLEPQLPREHSSRPQAEQRRVPTPKNPSGDLCAGSDSLPNSNSAAIQDVQSLAQQFGTVSIATKSPASSTAEATPLLNTFQQSHSLSSDLTATLPKMVPAKQEKTGAGRDKTVSPSLASGGIPDATKEYLSGSLSVPFKLQRPQHLLIVIDLNGTLLYRPDRKKPKLFHMRPHAQTFLKYCVNTFTVVIWSSARPENVKAMCNSILPSHLKHKVAAIWGRDKFGLTREDYDLRVQCYKRLSMIWKDPVIAATHPTFHRFNRWDQTNTVLIDDSREKARTEPHNLVEVPEWFGDINERDDILPQVHDYLNHLSMHSNVSSCLRSHPWRPTVF